MATSGSYNYDTTRTGIITRALRIVSAIGQGEPADATQLSEGSEALNDLIKEMATDGMPLWNIQTYSFSPVAGTSAYAIGTGSLINVTAPMKIIQAWYKNTSDYDTPITLITRDAYNLLPNKAQQGVTTQLYYSTPGNLTGGTGGEMFGTIYLYLTPDAEMANNVIYFVGQKQFQDFDAAANQPDFPSYWINALKWMLADQLSYEYGVPLAERAMISKKAEQHRLRALSFGTEEGSLYITPGMNRYG